MKLIDLIMMKIKIAKFFLIFTLVLLSINTCFPNDYDCFEDNGPQALVNKVVANTHATDSAPSSSEKESHYCICSMTCHTLFMSFTSVEKFTSYVVSYPEKYLYISHFYPEVSYSLEKPPAV